MKIIKSALCAALILFFFSRNLPGAMPLTETIYTIPEGEIEIAANAEIIRIDNDFRRETYKIGMGILPSLAIWYSFQYLHKGILKTDADELGDSFFRVWYYIGDFFRNSVHAGLYIDFRVPTGPGVYTGSEWRNLAFGNNEIKTGPVLQIDLPYHLYLHLNPFFVFRQGPDEGFYNGFSFDIFKKETYRDFFGLNFQSEGAFLSRDRLKNDYAGFSAALNADLFYPVILFTEIYGSRRVYNREKTEWDKLPIEGAGVNPVLMSFGLRYFFSEPVFTGLFYVYCISGDENYIKDIMGIDFSLQF